MTAFVELGSAGWPLNWTVPSLSTPKLSRISETCAHCRGPREKMDVTSRQADGEKTQIVHSAFLESSKLTCAAVMSSLPTLHPVMDVLSVVPVLPLQDDSARRSPLQVAVNENCVLLALGDAVLHIAPLTLHKLGQLRHFL